MKSVLLSALIALGIMAATVALALFIASMAPAKAAIAMPLDVDVALVLVVDTSDSIDANEFALQRLGIAAAFNDPVIIKAIQGGALGRIAVSMIDFAHEARVVVPWRVVSDAKTAKEFADWILLASRLHDIGDSTSISSGLMLGCQMIGGSPYRATRRVIDVSGDGSNNDDSQIMGTTMTNAKALATALKITINGLPIKDAEENVEDYYRDFVLTGPGSFLIPADNSVDFARAIRRKLIREVS